MQGLNFLVAGVGGQGTVLASDILAEVGMQAGYDVKKSDVLGLAIRGGSVLSHVRWGERVDSPVVRKGCMDMMLAFEPLEAMRGSNLMRSQSTIVCNTQTIAPISVASGDAFYPSKADIEAVLSSTAETVYTLNATREALQIGNAKVTNVIMLGAFSALLDVERSIWEKIVLSRVPDTYVDLNQQAFRLGRKLLEEEHNENSHD